MKVTLKEIAKKTGFGYGTVSRALSDDPTLVDPDTLEKIRAYAQKAGYTKNPFAAALVSGKTKDIGLIVPAMFVSPYYRDLYMKIITGIMEGLESTTYRLRVIFLRERSKLSAVEAEISRLKMKGIILSPYCYDFFLSEADIKSLDMPTVVFGKEVKGKNITSMTLNDFKGGRDGTRYLSSLGHEKIAVIRGFRGDIEKRYKGYLKAMEENKLKVYDEFVPQGDAMEGSGHDLTLKMLSGKRRPTAIYCLDDEMAFGAIKAIKEKGLNCPGDVSVLGFDGLEIGRYLDPPLTTMARPAIEMAKKSVEAILGVNGELKGKAVVFEADVREGGSCRKIR